MDYARAAMSKPMTAAMVQPEDNGFVSRRSPDTGIPGPQPAAEGQGRQGGDTARLCARRHHHAGDGIRRHPRKPRPRERCADARARRRDLRRRHSRLSSRRNSCATRSRAGRAIIPANINHPESRADDHRPQFPGQDQRQYRQFRGHLLHGRGSRQDGLGDPLGRRYGDGSVHRPQHPQHPRMDHAQFAGADRHRADLSGAGESRRHRRGPDLGGLSATR